MRSERFFYNVLGRICFRILLWELENSSIFCKAFFHKLLFAMWSYHYLNPKRGILRAFKLPSISHTWHDNTLQTPPPVRSFSCAYEVAHSTHENNMQEAFKARFCNNNWEEGRVSKNLSRQTTCVIERGVLERTHDRWHVWDLGNGTITVIINLDSVNLPTHQLSIVAIVLQNSSNSIAKFLESLWWWNRFSLTVVKP